jgi:hypothetical protein
MNPNNYPQQGNNTYKPPINAGGERANNVGSNVVCYECGQPGHMCPNHPLLKGNVRATAVQHEATLPMAGDPPSGAPPMEGEQDKMDQGMISLITQQSKSLLLLQQTYGTIMSPHMSGTTERMLPIASQRSCIALAQYGLPQRVES